MIPHFQCIIHQEVLCCKVLKLNVVLKRFVVMTSFIGAYGLKHWQFASLLCSLECDYEDLPYCTEICWLS
jgi:hypothetical protein